MGIEPMSDLHLWFFTPDLSILIPISLALVQGSASIMTGELIGCVACKAVSKQARPGIR
jgi:hypothetical protein